MRRKGFRLPDFALENCLWNFWDSDSESVFLTDMPPKSQFHTARRGHFSSFIVGEERTGNIAKRRLLVNPYRPEIQTESCCFSRENDLNSEDKEVFWIRSWPLCFHSTPAQMDQTFAKSRLKVDPLQGAEWRAKPGLVWQELYYRTEGHLFWGELDLRYPFLVQCKRGAIEPFWGVKQDRGARHMKT